MATTENLKAAFAGESQANRTYRAFAKKAEAEGYGQVAKLFRAAAHAETVHALAHLAASGRVKSTGENLQSAMEGEAHEFKEMYPEFVAEAEREENKRALSSFKNALAVEEIHHGLFTEASQVITTGKDMAGGPIVVCEVCGNTIMGEAPEACPVCGSPKSKFTQIR